MSEKITQIITPDDIAKIIFESIAGYAIKYPKIITINTKNFDQFGELSLPADINAWRIYKLDTDVLDGLTSIIDYCRKKVISHSLLMKNDEFFKFYLVEKLSRVFGTNTAIKCIALSAKSPIHVSIHLNRGLLSYEIVRSVMNFGVLLTRTKGLLNKKEFNISIMLDTKSELTNGRLKLLKKVFFNLLKYAGHIITENICDNNYILTTSSEKSIPESHQRYLCGSVLNHRTCKKENELSWVVYYQNKFDKVMKINEKKDNEVQNCLLKDTVDKIVRASINHELISTKHFQPVILKGCDDLDISIKETSFVLYNTVRMKAILKKSESLRCPSDCPGVIPLEEMQGFSEFQIKEEWTLIYNYIMRYPDVLSRCVTAEPNLEMNVYSLWIFILRLCHDFSRYYRKHRILMSGHKEIAIITSQRVHTLRALYTVLADALSLLGIEEVANM